MKRLSYLLQEAFRSLHTNRGSTVIGILTTAFTMASFGVFLLLYLNVRNLAGFLQEEVQVLVYLQEEVPTQKRIHLEKMLKQESVIDTIDFIDKQEAKKDFQRQFPEEASLLEGIDHNPFPESFVITVTAGSRSSEAVNSLVQRVQGLPGVEHVRYSRELVDRLALFVSYLEWGAITIGFILAVASVTIISNTVRLAFFARKEEIEILRLIGATGAFISLPYLVEGAILGALGGGLSVGLLRGGFEVFRLKIGGVSWMGDLQPVLEFFPVQISVLLVGCGLVLGCSGSLLSVYGWIKEGVS